MSDEFANGDEKDNMDLEEEEDGNDAVVDEKGHTNRGYGSTVPMDFFNANHIKDGSHIQIPREEGPMRNSVDFVQLTEMI